MPWVWLARCAADILPGLWCHYIEPIACGVDCRVMNKSGLNSEDIYIWEVSGLRVKSAYHFRLVDWSVDRNTEVGPRDIPDGAHVA
jgi:hypothetical protein